jgi:hypothetical protein
MLIFANLSGGAIIVDEAFRLGYTTIIFADVIGGTIFGNGFGIAFGTAASVTALLTSGAVYACIRITITVNALARTIVADIAFIFFIGAMFIVTAFGAFSVEAVFIIGFFAGGGFAVIVFVAFGVLWRASVSARSH